MPGLLNQRMANRGQERNGRFASKDELGQGQMFILFAGGDGTRTHIK